MEPSSQASNTEHAIQWDDAKIARLWDYYARYGGEGIYFANRFGARILKASRLPINERLTVLDFGCGPGHMWKHIERVGAHWKYAGIDFSQRSISQVTERAKGHANFLGAWCVDFLPTALSDSSFDAILLIEVLEHLNDSHLEETLTEVRRLLKPTGALIVTTPNEEDLSVCTKFCPECGAIFHEWQHVRSWAQLELESYMTEQGFRVNWSRQVDFGADGFRNIAARLARALVTGKLSRPHLIASFGKP